ncbi:hypothetical protein [Acidovorax sp. Leaf78]|uniref:hypothetical protein n=1 Tax=Acidovorax sp. Leaf78 TaxID=1736237 RepID=UPI0006F923F7|nr:hypothetical protein [Acidovorax sp. Leaf78]KQO27774.1 hypothetical protein ASF16_02820 [Acidovorax sp. Leaf78]
MAAGWITALKLVPWRDVIEATPQVLAAARKLMGSTRAGHGGAAGSDTAAGAPASLAATPEAALRQWQDRVVRLEQEQQASAVLIQSLAEQNAQVVQAVEALRKRSQRLTAAVAVLGVLGAGLLIQVLRQ